MDRSLIKVLFVCGPLVEYIIFVLLHSLDNARSLKVDLKKNISIHTFLIFFLISNSSSESNGSSVPILDSSTELFPGRGSKLVFGASGLVFGGSEMVLGGSELVLAPSTILAICFRLLA